MKKIYFLALTLLAAFTVHSQNYELGLVHVSGYDFKVVAIPDFDSSGNTNVSDISFTLALPAGSADVVNPVSELSGRSWTVEDQYDATFLSGIPLGDGTRDLFQIFIPTGQSLVSHTSGQQIDLISFQVSNSPTSGLIEFLPNNDPIVLGAGGILNNYYNTDLDGPGGNPTADYFSNISATLGNFNFASLSIEDITLDNAKISIYPNPTKGILNIESNKTISYAIYNILGQSVKLNGVLENDRRKSLDLSHLPDGIYVLKAKDDSNKSKSFKIIKKE